MKSTEFATEAFSGPEFPDEKVDHKFVDSQIHDATKLMDVSSSLSLWQKGEFFVLKKDQSVVVGYVKMSEIEFITLPKQIFNHIDLVYILPEFRKTPAIKWLIYAVKEKAKYPVVADGAIFKGGQDLILSMKKLGMSRIFAFNKITGQKQELSGLINDPDYCYIFESTRLGFGKNYFNEDQTPELDGWVWYPLFEDF